MHFLNCDCQIHSVHLWHQAVGEQVIRMKEARGLQGGPAVVGGCDVKAGILQDFSKRVHNEFLVVNHEHLGATEFRSSRGLPIQSKLSWTETKLFRQMNGS